MKRSAMWVISVFVVCLLVGSAYFLIFYKESADKERVIDKTVTVNNTISPENTTQGVFLEVKRIHKKGIENEFRKISDSWKKKPTFYFEAIVDNAKWIGDDIND
jgi:alpha-acetolactate decarboxylase